MGIKGETNQEKAAARGASGQDAEPGLHSKSRS